MERYLTEVTERPCRNCASANKACTYAVRDRKITVTESYLRNLEGGLLSPKTLEDAAKKNPNQTVEVSKNENVHDSPIDESRPTYGSVVENYTADLFISKLKQIQIANSASGTLSVPLDNNDDRSSGQNPNYEYFALDFDSFRGCMLYCIQVRILIDTDAKCTFKLPPYQHAVHLLNQFITFLGHDWHWFCLLRFRQRLDNTYKVTNSAESKDRIWLCQLQAMFALGESVDSRRHAKLNLYPNDHSPESNQGTESCSVPPAGTKLFEQAMQLLNIPYENATIHHVETLNLIVSTNNRISPDF